MTDNLSWGLCNTSTAIASGYRSNVLSNNQGGPLCTLTAQLRNLDGNLCADTLCP